MPKASAVSYTHLPYTWWEEASGEETSLIVNVIPGQTYAVWVQHGHGEVAVSYTHLTTAWVRCTLHSGIPRKWQA